MQLRREPVDNISSTSFVILASNTNAVLPGNGSSVALSRLDEVKGG